MASNPASEIVSALQSVSIKQNPSIEHDLNPSTAASQKIPADIVSSSSPHQHQHQHHARTYSSGSAQTSTSTSTISSDVIRPRARPQPGRRTMPPLPDFRFEQSYLSSIKNARSNYEVAYITLKDQVVWPLVSGLAYNLIMFGWRFWNRDVKLRGSGVGARVRRWWWEVNNWVVPPNDAGMRGRGNTGVAREAEEFYIEKFGSAQGD